MSGEWAQIARQLKHAVAAFDHPATQQLGDELIALIRRDGPPAEEGDATSLLKCLRGKRDFELLRRCADALMQVGLRTPEIRKLYAQALLDQGSVSGALPFLEALLQDTGGQPETAGEHTEAQGLLGRAWKQIYVDTNNPHSVEAHKALNNAIGAYHSVYKSDPAEHGWHGINAAALLHRAAVDEVSIHGVADPDWRAIALAQEILGLMDIKWLNNRASMWDCGTAMEAAAALGRQVEARQWLNRYVREPGCDAFELASTLRQMTDVWRLDAATEPGASLLPILQAEQLKRQGGQLQLSPRQLSAGKLAGIKPENLEKILGKVRYVSYKFMLRAIERARSVARIEHDPGQGFGTGFVVRGGDLHSSLGDELLLLTNSHVVSEDTTAGGALHPDEATISFQLLREEGRADEDYTVDALLWSSPPGVLDASLLRLKRMPEGLIPFPIAPRLPLADGDQRVYVVGHPRGGSLSFSIQDNQLLDHEAPRIHYRAPTEGGSSGSPVFNAQWKLIGLHHAGGRNLRKLNGKGGVYEANEGLWIQSIIEAIKNNPQKIAGQT